MACTDDNNDLDAPIWTALSLSTITMEKREQEINVADTIRSDVNMGHMSQGVGPKAENIGQKLREKPVVRKAKQATPSLPRLEASTNPFVGEEPVTDFVNVHI